MPIDVKLVRIFIASPSDVLPERDAIEEVITRWNRINAVGQRIQFLPLRWEHAPREYGDHPQAVVNRTQVDESDALVGIFHARLGSETPEAKSGTVEEIDRCHASGKSCKLYFCTTDPPQDVLEDNILREQYERLHAYKQTIDNKSLHGTYAHIGELKDKFFEDLSDWARRFIDEDMAAQSARERARSVVASAAPNHVEHAMAGPSTLRELLPETYKTGAARIFENHANTYRALISSPGFESSSVTEAVEAIEESCAPLLQEMIYIGHNDPEMRLYAPLVSLFETLALHPSQSGLVWRNTIRRYGALLAFTTLGLAQLASGSMSLIRQLAETKILDTQRWRGGNPQPQPMLDLLGYHEVFYRIEDSISATSSQKRTPVSDHLLDRLGKLFPGHTHQFEVYFETWELLWMLQASGSDRACGSLVEYSGTPKTEFRLPI